MEVFLENGKTAEIAEGTTGRDLAAQLHLTAPDQALAAQNA